MSGFENSQTALRDHYPCVIIGGGLGGLTMAGLLGLNDVECLVLEKNAVTGGCIFDYPAGAYTASHTIDWMSGLHPGGLFGKLLEKLGVSDELRFQPLPAFKRVLLGDHDVIFHADLCRFTEGLLARFPHEEKGILAYRDLVASFGTPAWIDHFRPHKDDFYLALLRHYFSDPALISILSSNINDTMPAYLMILFQHRCFKGHAYVPQGFSYTDLFDRLSARISALGATILTGTEVASVVVRDRQTRGVVLADGREIMADMVVSAIDLRQLYENLIPADAGVATGFRERLRERKAAYSLVSIFAGVHDTFPALGGGGEPIVWVPSPRIEDLFSADPRLWHVKVNIRSRHLPFLAPAGHSAVDIRALVTRDVFAPWEKDPDYRSNPGYLARKAEIAECLLENSRHILGDFRGKVEVSRVATPLTFQRFTRNSGGSGLGWELGPREYLNGFRVTSPLQNLYHVGQWASFPGVEGVVNYCFSLAPLLVRKFRNARAVAHPLV